MTRRRQLAIRAENFARTASLAWFWLRHGHGPLHAWQKAQVTL